MVLVCSVPVPGRIIDNNWDANVWCQQLGRAPLSSPRYGPSSPSSGSDEIYDEKRQSGEQIPSRHCRMQGQTHRRCKNGVLSKSGFGKQKDDRVCFFACQRTRVWMVQFVFAFPFSSKAIYPRIFLTNWIGSFCLICSWYVSFASNRRALDAQGQLQVFLREADRLAGRHAPPVVCNQASQKFLEFERLLLLFSQVERYLSLSLFCGALKFATPEDFIPPSTRERFCNPSLHRAELPVSRHQYGSSFPEDDWHITCTSQLRPQHAVSQLHPTPLLFPFQNS